MEETVLITGAGRGLGLALARSFLRGGYRVFAGARSLSSALEQLLREFPESASWTALDVSDPGSIRAAARDVSAKTHRLDVLINNAAVNFPQSSAPLEQLDLADSTWERTLSTNALGPLRVTQQFLALVERGGRKIVVNISSEAGSIGDCGRTREFAYCMSKAALNMESKLLHNYLSPRGVQVLAVHPGWVRTDMGGPNATLSMEESAQALYALVTKTRSDRDPIYFDYTGKALPW